MNEANDDLTASERAAFSALRRDVPPPEALEREVEGMTLDEIKRVAAKYFQEPYVLATVRPPNQPAAAKNK